MVNAKSNIIIFDVFFSRETSMLLNFSGLTKETPMLLPKVHINWLEVSSVSSVSRPYMMIL